MTASVFDGSMNPTDITPRFSFTYTGDHPEAD